MRKSSTPGRDESANAQWPAGPAAGADQVGRELAQLAQQDRTLLVPVGVERNAPLLHQHGAESLGRVERLARKVRFHSGEGSPDTRPAKRSTVTESEQVVLLKNVR
jgi:hypothetical protein